MRTIYKALIAVLIPAIIYILLIVFASGCGGGSGAAPVPAPTTGSLTGYVDRDAVARVMPGRRANLSGLAGATVSAGDEGTPSTTADDTGRFTLTGIGPGDYVEITAASGTATLKCYVKITAGQTATKNIDARTTAAAMIYKKMVENSIATPESISSIEAATLLRGVEAEIETGLAGADYDYSTVLGGTNVAEVITRLQAGASVSDTTGPTLTFTYPGEDGEVSDYDFQDDSFYIQFGYSDDTALYADTLSVSLTMDDGAAQDISGYFSATDASTIKGTGLYVYTETLFAIQSNDQTRQAAVSVTAEDVSGNTSTESWNFTVYPSGPGGTPQ